ncbi:SRPBCC family protein [Iamia sp. SCSIO 61187]|uniref:SRPBCC family protein n=1 Tax=Iamia sp. SCSIO 61187 TaxID=2722752 RepID=UPI001C6251A6|nr:SRPBCC family protein [Iamia sp. SCSIO 61187]
MELTNTFTVATPIDEMWPILCDIERIAPCMPGAQLTEVEGEEYRGEVKLKVGPINARFKGTATMVERDDDGHRAVLKASGKDTGGKGNANATITASATATADGGTEVTITSDLSITGKVAQFGRSAMADISTKLLGQFVDCLESRVLAGGSADDAGGGPDDAQDEPGDAGDGSRGAGAATGDGETDAATPPGGVGEAPVVDVTEAATAASAGPGSPVETAPVPPAGGVPAGSAAVGGGTTSATAGDGGDAGTAAPGTAGARRVEGPEAEPIDLLETAGVPVAKKVAFPVAAVMAIFFALYWRRRHRK